MTGSTGSSPRRASFGATDAWTGSVGAGLVACVVLGVLIVLADVHLRLPLHMPGWRGVIGMGLLVLARRITGQPWGASLTALASALASFYLAQDMRFGPLAYLLPGLVVDLVCNSSFAARRPVLGAAVAAGLGNLAKLAVGALSAMLLASKGFGFGLAGAALSHVLFGAIGGALAALAWRRPRSP